MKKKLTFIMILVVLALTSCSDFLDKYPKYGVDPESEVTNEIAVALTTACYKTLQSSNMYNQRIWSLDIIAGNSEVGAGGGTDGLETVQASNFITQSDNGFALYVWRSPWVGIGRCNIVLSNLPSAAVSNEIRPVAWVRLISCVHITIIFWFVCTEGCLCAWSRLNRENLRILPVIR